ncbi:MAG: PHP domain-containing protein [bacterium]|nr:MAG: PHP domain-containing protein [bacterium]
MIDLHMHSIFSDGVLLPAELARRAESIGCRYIAITDHVDQSNVTQVAEAIVRFSEDDEHECRVIPGVEVTHVTPGKIADVVKAARGAGARIVLVHGETVVEPVEPGTNEAAIDAGADILAHPGLIKPETAQNAAAAKVALEISGRKGHSFANGHLVRMGTEHGATLIFSSDAHKPSDLINHETALRIIRGAGLTKEQAVEIMANSQTQAEACCGSL